MSTSIKITLTIVIVIAGSVAFAIVRGAIGGGHYFVTAAMGFALYLLWRRPRAEEAKR